MVCANFHTFHHSIFASQIQFYKKSICLATREQKKKKEAMNDEGTCSMLCYKEEAEEVRTKD